MKLRYKIGLVVFVLGSVFVWGRCGRRTTVPKTMLPTVLPVKDKEQIIVDPFHHVIQIVTATGVKHTTLPDRPSTIDILKDGSVKVTSPQFGTELRPFVGVGFNLRSGVILGGVDLLYWKKLDLGIGLSMNPSHIQDTAALIGVSYNLYSNTSISLGIDNRHAPMIAIHVRL